MTKRTNDNADLFAPLPRTLFAVTMDLLASTPIGAAANFDRESEGAAGNADRSRGDEQRERAEREYIEYRLRKTRAFEEEAAGLRRRPRRGGPGIGFERNR